MVRAAKIAAATQEAERRIRRCKLAGDLGGALAFLDSTLKLVEPTDDELIIDRIRHVRSLLEAATLIAKQERDADRQFGSLPDPSILRARIETINKIEFRTSCLPNGEWMAIDDNTYDGPGSIKGLGCTKDAAVDDLIDQMMERV